MKIFVLDSSYAGPFKALGECVYSAPENLEGIDMVVFPGGPDVPPERYGEREHPYTRASKEQYAFFDKVYEAARKRNIPMVGICGGGQYLCVQAGGSLVQHITNHAIGGTHPITTQSGEVIKVTSTHHQMMNPYSVPHVLVAWAEALSTCYRNGNDEEVWDEGEDIVEPDVVFFPEINALSIQYHPEYMSENSRGWTFAQECVQKYLLSDDVKAA